MPLGDSSRDPAPTPQMLALIAEVDREAAVSTTGEAGMAAGDPIGREAAKYLAIRHDTDEEYMEGYELWLGHQEAHR